MSSFSLQHATHRKRGRMENDEDLGDDLDGQELLDRNEAEKHALVPPALRRTSVLHRRKRDAETENAANADDDDDDDELAALSNKFRRQVKLQGVRGASLPKHDVVTSATIGRPPFVASTSPAASPASIVGSVESNRVPPPTHTALDRRAVAEARLRYFNNSNAGKDAAPHQQTMGGGMKRTAIQTRKRTRGKRAATQRTRKTRRTGRTRRTRSARGGRGKHHRLNGRSRHRQNRNDINR